MMLLVETEIHVKKKSLIIFQEYIFCVVSLKEKTVYALIYSWYYWIYKRRQISHYSINKWRLYLPKKTYVFVELTALQLVT